MYLKHIRVCNKIIFKRLLFTVYSQLICKLENIESQAFFAVPCLFDLHKPVRSLVGDLHQPTTQEWPRNLHRRVINLNPLAKALLGSCLINSFFDQFFNYGNRYE